MCRPSGITILTMQGREYAGFPHFLLVVRAGPLAQGQIHKCTSTRWQLARQGVTFPQVAGVLPTTLMNQLLSLLPVGDHPETMFLLLFLDRLLQHISSQLTARSFRHP